MEDEKNAPKKPDNTELAFKLYDKDKDGFITKSEMSKVSKRLSKEQVDKVMLTTAIIMIIIIMITSPGLY